MRDGFSLGADVRESLFIRAVFKSVARGSVRIEDEFDVLQVVDEGLEACVWIAVEGGAGDDQHPASVPGGAADEAVVQGDAGGLIAVQVFVVEESGEEAGEAFGLAQGAGE